MIAPHERAPEGLLAARAAEMRGVIPSIDTERLILRAPEIADFPVLEAIVNGPGGDGVGGPMSREDAWFDFAQMTATWLWRGHGWWAVVDRATGTVVGFVGIGFEPGDHEPELGYMLTDAARGQGYAFEACRAALDHASALGGLDTLVSYIFTGNARSVRLAERLGATRDRDAEAALSPEDDAFVFRHQLRSGAVQ